MDTSRQVVAESSGSRGQGGLVRPKCIVECAVRLVITQERVKLLLRHLRKSIAISFN